MMTNKELDELKAQFPPLPKEKPLAYKIYNYLKTNARGYKNRVKADVLMSEFGITDNKTLRSYIQEIRESEILQKAPNRELSLQILFRIYSLSFHT